MTSVQKMYYRENTGSSNNTVKQSVSIQIARLAGMTLLSVLLMLMTGCTETIILTSEMAYNHLRGDFLNIVPNKLDDVYTASLEAAKQMDHYQVVDHQLTAIGGTVTAMDEDARTTTITLSKTENDQTQIQIRIGIIGDKLRSSHIYDCIREQLRSPRMVTYSYSKNHKAVLSAHTRIPQRNVCF
jgi:hypothetical protein